MSLNIRRRHLQSIGLQIDDGQLAGLPYRVEHRVVRTRINEAELQSRVIGALKKPASLRSE